MKKDGINNFAPFYMTQSFFGWSPMRFIMYLIIVSSKATYVAKRCCFY
jgi:hypothetical protein